MIKSCGGCKHWTKWPEDGLCESQDLRCPSDYVCEEWKGKKYSRNKSKTKLIQIIEEEIK